MGRRIKSDRVVYGRNSENVALDDARYVKCWNCGFICHLDRDARSKRGSTEGDGISQTKTLRVDL